MPADGAVIAWCRRLVCLCLVGRVGGYFGNQKMILFLELSVANYVRSET